MLILHYCNFNTRMYLGYNFCRFCRRYLRAFPRLSGSLLEGDKFISVSLPVITTKTMVTRCKRLNKLFIGYTHCPYKENTFSKVGKYDKCRPQVVKNKSCLIFFCYDHLNLCKNEIDRFFWQFWPGLTKMFKETKRLLSARSAVWERSNRLFIFYVLFSLKKSVNWTIFLLFFFSIGCTFFIQIFFQLTFHLVDFYPNTFFLILWLKTTSFCVFCVDNLQ